MNENDLNVVASFTKRVEDLHSGKKRSHRIRRIRHRAQKRSRKNKSSLQKQNLEIVEQTIEQKPIEVIEDISVTENNISKTELVIPPIPKVESINKTNIEKTDVVKEKSMKIEKKINELSKVRNSLPLVDLCRDRRRRISSIKRSSTENITRNDIAKALKPNYSVQKTALKQSFMPTWAKFSLSWNDESSILDSLRNVKINSSLNNLPLITLAA
jgi:hypothetical protein